MPWHLKENFITDLHNLIDTSKTMDAKNVIMPTIKKQNVDLSVHPFFKTAPILISKFEIQNEC